MNFKKMFLTNMEQQRFFFWKKEIEKSTDIQELFQEISEIDSQIKKLQLRKNQLIGSVAIVKNNILKEKYEQS